MGVDSFSKSWPQFSAGLGKRDGSRQEAIKYNGNMHKQSKSLNGLLCIGDAPLRYETDTGIFHDHLFPKHLA